MIRKLLQRKRQADTGVGSREVNQLRGLIEQQMILQGRALALANAARAPLPSPRDAEFKVFSQFGEDGILQHLIRETGITPAETSFIEFGVQDYRESNTRFLLMNDNWRGLILDGSPVYMDRVRGQDIHWRHDLTVRDVWIDRDNINSLFLEAGFSGPLGVLSIDIDGNDYWVWERIEVVEPVIVVIEWNSVFGPRHAVTTPYDPLFSREQAHHSCLYWGASVSALSLLAERKGYALVCSNSAGNNLFFVRRERLGHLRALTPEEAYVESRFRDSRDAEGRLNFLSGVRRVQEINRLPLVRVSDGAIVTLAELES